MHIRDYLCQAAAEMTDQSLSTIRTKEDWLQARPTRIAQYREMLGIHSWWEKKRTPLNVTVTGVLERDDVTIHKLFYEALPKLYVTGNLYVPKGLQGRAPAILYVCGHGRQQKVWYQNHARRWAQLGFVTLLIETIQLGEFEGWHHGCYTYGHWQWYSRGYTPAGVEAWDAIRAIDLLQERDDVFPDKIGMTGISGGGATTWWTAAADERIRVAAPVCGTGTVRAHLRDRTWDGHCDCMTFINTYGYDLADCGALIAPRPLMIASADRDSLYSVASVRETYAKIKRIYDLYGAGENCRLLTWRGEHGYQPSANKTLFSFFIKHLMGKDVSPEEIEDVGEPREKAEALHVFVSGLPSDEITTKIQESFVPLAEPPVLSNEADVVAERARLVALLREKTFHQFPQETGSLDVELHFEFLNGETQGARYQFTSEAGWRLTATVLRPPATQGKTSPALLYLAHRDDGRWAFERFASRFDASWVRVGIQVRGVGETGWDPHLQWHIRRNAALLGRTIASMQVYDALRALEFVSGLEGVDKNRLTIAGRGQMAVVALYAALLRGNTNVILETPPATHNAPGNPDGTGDAIELLNVLRFTDLPYVAGLLYPASLTFVGDVPESYAWTENLYRKLNGTIQRIPRDN